MIAGGGVHYSGAEAELARFAETHNMPVVETMAARPRSSRHHPFNTGPDRRHRVRVGQRPRRRGRRRHRRRNPAAGLHDRLVDGVRARRRFVGINAASFDAVKHRSLPVVGDALESLAELGAALGHHRFATTGPSCAAEETARVITPTSTRSPRRHRRRLPTYAQVVGAIDRSARPTDYALTAAGGFPGELNNGWRATGLDSLRLRVRVLLHGLRDQRGVGAKMAMPQREVIAFVGDGSYLMMNRDLYSSVLSGHKLVVIVCDNGGFAVINRLQVNQGGVPFNNQLEDTRHRELVRVDFAAHAASMGCRTETVAHHRRARGGVRSGPRSRIAPR